MLRSALVAALAGAVLTLLLPGCYTQRAMRAAGKTLERGSDFDEFGPWVLVTAPGAVLIAGGQLAVGSVIPLGKGVDPREPDDKWYHAYGGEMRPPTEVGILCHDEPATWFTGIRSAAGGAWRSARDEKWHFPVCIEALPGRYELEVNYFEREHESDRDESVSLQAESTEPTYVVWQAVAGQVDLMEVHMGKAQPAQGRPPQRHIPRSRALGTTWWQLNETEWFVSIQPESRWDEAQAEVVDQRAAWAAWEGRRP